MTNKYNARTTYVDGIKFDSKLEARRYQDLVLLQDAGQIRELTIHPTFNLLQPFTDEQGRKHRRVDYEADFRYFDVDRDAWIVEDIKGSAKILTKAHRIKWKWVIKLYGHSYIFEHVFKDGRRQ